MPTSAMIYAEVRICPQHMPDLLRTFQVRDSYVTTLFTLHKLTQKKYFKRLPHVFLVWATTETQSPFHTACWHNALLAICVDPDQTTPIHRLVDLVYAGLTCHKVVSVGKDSYINEQCGQSDLNAAWSRSKILALVTPNWTTHAKPVNCLYRF